MKKIFTIGLVLTSMNFFSQAVSSVANGNWTNPATWNCTCVPINGNSVTISHSVTLNTSMLFNTGGITINNNGSLVHDAARDIMISGGYFYNNGNASFRFFNLASGTGSNSGTFSITAITNSVSLTNAGTINMDSMYVAGNFTNTSTGKVNGNKIAFVSPVMNDGRITVSLSLNSSTMTNNNYHGGYAFTNNGLYNNNDSIILTYSMWNKIRFNNNAGSLIKLTKNFHNYTIGNTASFNNNGNVIILDSYYNSDTVRGTITGTFTVADSSSNSGRMNGNFKFCDQTPPGAAPYVDFNIGVISNGITWCAPAGIKINEMKVSFSIYPNPSSGVIYVSGTKEEVLSLYDNLGKRVQLIELNKENNFDAKIDGLNEGMYFLKGENSTKKIMILK